MNMNVVYHPYAGTVPMMAGQMAPQGVAGSMLGGMAGGMIGNVFGQPNLGTTLGGAFGGFLPLQAGTQVVQGWPQYVQTAPQIAPQGMVSNVVTTLARPMIPLQAWPQAVQAGAMGMQAWPQAVQAGTMGIQAWPQAVQAWPQYIQAVPQMASQGIIGNLVAGIPTDGATTAFPGQVGSMFPLQAWPQTIH